MSGPAPGERLWNLMRGAMATKAVAVVADLGVADALGDGSRPVAEVAKEVGAHPDSLHRFLRALASDGVFEEHAPGVFGNTPASELLRRGEAWHAFAHLFGGDWYTAVGDMEAVTGEATFPKTFGTDFWTWLAEHPHERAAFDRAMEEGKERRVDRLAALDWRDNETVVDVGGGNGSHLLALLERQPGLRGIVFDLPETNRDESRFGDRCEFVVGSFFERVPEGDVYILSGILHDWDDEHAAAILRTIRPTARPRSRLLIVDAVIEPGNEPHGSKWLDLLLLVIAAGRERTEEEWRALLSSTGWEPVQIEDGLIQAQCR
jgi:O-methyltransferase/methyltransferase family protein